MDLFLGFTLWYWGILGILGDFGYLRGFTGFVSLRFGVSWFLGFTVFGYGDFAFLCVSRLGLRFKFPSGFGFVGFGCLPVCLGFVV